MKSLFWKKFDIKKSPTSPKIEEGINLIYLEDQNKYLYIGGVKPRDLDEKPIQEKSEQKSNQPSGGINFSLGGASKGNTGGSGIKFSLGNLSKPNNLIEYVYTLDPADFTWTEHKCNGKLPEKRTMNSCWYEAPYIFIYGGKSGENKTLNDMYVLNVEDYQWRRFFYLEKPPSRLDFQLVNMGSKKYLIAGASMPENWFYNDVYNFSFDNVVWNSNSLEIPGVVWEKMDLRESELFQPMKAHSAVKVSDTQIFIFGGFNEKKICTDNSILLDVENGTIVEFETRGVKPSARAYSKLIPVKENLICLFGGISCSEDQINSVNAIILNDLYILNLNEGYWTKPQVGGYIPAGRYLFGLAGNRSEYQSEMILMGGRSTDSQPEKWIYVISELANLAQNEEWDNVDNNQNSKLQFENYRAALKGKKNQNKFEYQNVSAMTQEFSQAEKLIVEQKRKIVELEILLKKIQEENQETQVKHIEYETKLKNFDDDFDESIQDLINEVNEQEQKNNERDSFILKVKNLVGEERKRRKLLQLKQFHLQESMKDAENLIITLDSIFTKSKKDDLLEGIINENQISKLESLKQNHKQALIHFKKGFEILVQNENKIKQQVHEKKVQLKEEHNISQHYKSMLNKEEIEFLKNKK